MGKADSMKTEYAFWNRLKKYLHWLITFFLHRHELKEIVTPVSSLQSKIHPYSTKLSYRKKERSLSKAIASEAIINRLQLMSIYLYNLSHNYYIYPQGLGGITLLALPTWRANY